MLLLLQRIFPSLCLLLLVSSANAADNRIRPAEANPFYWQYKGEPVLLLGGSVSNYFFQLPDFEERLDTMQAVGANYIRITMDDLPNTKVRVSPFKQQSSGKYDLEQFNEEYWSRFERMLRLTAAREIIVQIEVWDRFNYSRDNWPPHPFNPINNVNYSAEESGLALEYPEHPGHNKQPVFFTTPKQSNNRVVLRYQQKFVDKMLSHSLNYEHVLYCIDNETSGEEAWATYWAEFIRERATAAGRKVCITQMWDDWDLHGERHRRTLDHPERYDFVDVSQNTHNKGQLHWDNLQWVRNHIQAKPRPINTAKIYGADNNKFGHNDQDAIERFWRHLLGGAASVRFHRPPAGLGLTPKAIACIQAARKVESLLKFWKLEPANDLLSDREPNEAYLAAARGRAYVLYFTDGGSVDVDLSGTTQKLTLQWINVDRGEFAERSSVEGGSVRTIAAPAKGNWVAVIR